MSLQQYESVCKEQFEKINEKLDHTSEELDHADVYVHTAPKAFSTRRSAKAHAEGKANVSVMDKKDANVIATIHDDGTVTIVFHDKFDSEHKERLLQVARKLKEDLPEGYELKVKLHDDSETFTITVTGIEDDKDQEGVVKKIIDTIKIELEKIKE